MDHLKKSLSDALEKRAITSKACTDNPGNAALIDADNAAMEKVHDADLKLRIADEHEQYHGESCRSQTIPTTTVTTSSGDIANSPTPSDSKSGA